MKGVMKRTLPVFILALLLAVAPRAALAFEDAVADVEWKVLEIGGKKIEGDAGMLVFHRNKVAGRAACNRLFGQFNSIPNKGVAFNQIGTTRMMCEGKMEFERQLLDALEKVRGYKHDGLTLLLLDETGGVLVKLVQ